MAGLNKSGMAEEKKKGHVGVEVYRMDDMKLQRGKRRRRKGKSAMGASRASS